MQIFRNLFIISLLACSLQICEAELVLKYDKPAENWESQALPIGNGRMGECYSEVCRGIEYSSMR